MPCLIEAFKEMRRKGLIAKRACCCPDHGRERIEEAARKRRRKHRPVVGFVHFGLWDPAPALDELRMPLVFGAIRGGRAACGGADCVAVGEIVAECLSDEGIAYEWDRTPESPIFVAADDMLSGFPAGTHDREIPWGEDPGVLNDFRNLSFGFIPDSAFDRLDENPVRLLNLAKLRPPDARARRANEPPRPRVGDRVKLGFLIPGAIDPRARARFGNLVDNFQLESRSVEVTQVLRTAPERVYRGELLDSPLLIDPDKLPIGAPVTFTSDMVYPADGAR